MVVAIIDIAVDPGGDFGGPGGGFNGNRSSGKQLLLKLKSHAQVHQNHRDHYHLRTVYSFQFPGVFAAFLVVFLGGILLFAACVFLLGFAWFSLFLLFFAMFCYFSLGT